MIHHYLECYADSAMLVGGYSGTENMRAVAKKMQSVYKQIVELLMIRDE